MGAAGARQVMRLLENAGFQPIELERYCTSNKIWSTKVKRLRLPDLLCVRTGTRIEVRAKSDLKIRMSDAPTNPDRRWNSGMRKDDLSAFIACFDDEGTPKPADEAVFFSFGDLEKTEGVSSLGPPKSASEGAERDRTWPCVVPQRNGVVDSVDKATITVIMEPDEDRPVARRQTFQLRGKVAYVSPGDRFKAQASIIAGVPARRVDIRTYLNNRYNPLVDIDSQNAVDRYAAVKSVSYLLDKKKEVVAAIDRRLSLEKEERVLLEAAGAGTLLESQKAWDCLASFVWKQERADLRMKSSGFGIDTSRLRASTLIASPEIRPCELHHSLQNSVLTGVTLPVSMRSTVQGAAGISGVYARAVRGDGRDPISGLAAFSKILTFVIMTTHDEMVSRRRRWRGSQ
jgi:hypothetical protein